jgi:membrane protein
MISSALMVIVGTFCVANSTAAFTSVAFVIGGALLVMGALELIVFRNVGYGDNMITKTYVVQAVISTFLGVMFLSGQVSEDVSVSAIFAMMLMTSGLAADFSINIDIRTNSLSEKRTFILGTAMTLLGAYMFFNKSVLDIHVMLLIGVAAILIGVDRFRISMSLDYNKPEFLSKNEEKLERAKREEKRNTRIAIEATRRSREQRNKIKQLEEEISKERARRESAAGARRSKK